MAQQTEWVEANFHSMFEYFAERSSEISCLAEGGLLRSVCSIPYAFFNSVISTQLTEAEVEDKIQEMIGEYGSRGQTFNWYVHVTDQPASLGQRLERSGLVHRSRSLNMALPLSQLPDVVEMPEGLEIVLAQDEADIAAFCQTALTVFGNPPALVKAVEPTMARLALGAGARVTLYLGRLHGETVATTYTYEADGVVGVYYVTTVPAARQRGIGKALTLHALQEAKKAGNQTAILQSSKMGAGVYKSIGFEECGEMDIYVYQCE